MFPEKPEKVRPRAKRFGVEFEEERAWVSFYRRVRHDATLATEVLAQLEADAEMKRTHLALVLCCKEALRAHKARCVRFISASASSSAGSATDCLPHPCACCAAAVTSPSSACPRPARNQQCARCDA